ncbi:MAG: hypothetical protein ACP5KN_16385, partial [Armatimonadota bacterium]
PEPVRRPRRRRSRQASSRRAGQTLALLQTPVLQRCGRCGRRETVLGDAVVCRHCGGLIFRDDENLQ